MKEEGNQPVIVQVTPRLHQRAHQHARRQGWASTSSWLRHLLMSWNGKGLRPRNRRQKQLAVRLDDRHRRRLKRLAQRSKTSESEAFAMLVERALADEDVTRPALDVPSVHESPPPDHALTQWADAVLAAAHATPHKFGERKAFIAGVVDELISRFQPGDPAAFSHRVRARLLDLNRHDLIRLVRADLIPVMDFNLVDRSELTHMKATFHFVMLD